MHEVMHKTEEDYNYHRTDLRFDIKPIIACAILQNLPFGLRNLRSPTLDKLERVSCSALGKEIDLMPKCLISIGIEL